MIDKLFGSIDGRELHLRFCMPLLFTEWTDPSFRLAWRELLRPRNWWRVARSRYSWRMECSRWDNMNHRCYCTSGCMIDGCIFACGFGVLWWYSYFDGKIPCPCDEALEALEVESAPSPAAQ
jgi:hypothetical protein